MGFNFKLLKYNLTLALVLSGWFYIEHPDQLKYIVSNAGLISTEIKETIKLPKTQRNLASTEFTGVNINESNGDVSKSEPNSHQDLDEDFPDNFKSAPPEPDFKKYPDVDGLEDRVGVLDKVSKLPSKLLNKIKEKIMPVPPVPESKKDETFGGFGFFTPPKKEPESSTGSGSRNCAKPNIPSSLTSQMINNQANLSWTPLSTGVTYNIFRGTDSSAPSLIASNLSTSSFIDTTMNPGVSYFYQLSTSNSCGHSLSYTQKVYQTSLGSFAITSNIASSDSINLIWSLSSGATEYQILYGTSTGNYSHSRSNAVSPLSLALSGGQTYYIKLKAKNNFGEIESLESNIYVPTSFESNLTFDLNSDYLFDPTTLSLSSGIASLIPSNLISEKTTSNGTGTILDNIFNDYVQLDSNLILDNDAIKMTSGASSTYISKVFDGKNDISSWQRINFITPLPYGKELSLSQEGGYGDLITDFSDRLSMLYYLNGTTGSVAPNNSIINSPISGQSASLKNADNLGLQFVPGKLKQGLRFDGVDDHVITNYTQTAVTAYTVSVWMRTTTTGVKKVFVHNRGSGAGRSLTLGMGTTGGGHGTAGQISWEVDSDSIDIGLSSTQTFNDGNWHHVVGTWAAPAGTAIHHSQFKIYVDGNQVATTSGTTGSLSSPLTGLGTTILGYHQPWGTYFPGDLDEVAVWSKELSLSEIQELYIRGANRVKMQIRTCSEKYNLDCSGTISNWVGFDGTGSTYFSEQVNNLSPLSSVGSVRNSFYTTPFYLFTNGLTSWLGIGKNGTNRYIQYKAILESDTTLSFPEILQVSFTPSTRRSFLSSIINTSPVEFINLSKIEVSHTCFDANSNSIDDDIRYEISFDAGSSFWSFKNGNWVTSSSFNTANTKSELDLLGEIEYKLIPASLNKLVIKSYLSSNGSSDCSIDNVKITGSK